jgi:hypothetical protein
MRRPFRSLGALDKLSWCPRRSWSPEPDADRRDDEDEDAALGCDIGLEATIPDASRDDL